MGPSDDEFRGAITAQLAGVERRLDAMDTRAGVLGESITSIRMDMTAMRALVEQTAKNVEQTGRNIEAVTKDREQERDDLITQLQQALTAQRAMLPKWALATIPPLVASVVAALIIFALTGGFGK